MKYLTKEWYQKMQASDLHVGLSAHEGCLYFDEDLYRKIYDEREMEYIETQRQIYDMDLDEISDVFNRDDLKTNDDRSTQNDLNQKEKKRIKNIAKRWKKKKSFDESKSKQDFKTFNDPQTEFVKARLEMIPSYIKENIADERMFVLGYATKEIIDDLENISMANQMEIEKTLDMYHKENITDNEKVNKLSFHDFQVKKMKQTRNKLKIYFTSGYPFRSIEFKETEILELGEINKHVFWLYEEVYENIDGYEIHVMFSDLSYLTLKCHDFIIK